VQRPREKKRVFRKEKDAGRHPDSKVKRREDGRAFQSEGPMVAKDLVWAIVVLTLGTKRTCQLKERSGRCDVADKVERI